MKKSLKEMLKQAQKNEKAGRLSKALRDYQDIHKLFPGNRAAVSKLRKLGKVKEPNQEDPYPSADDVNRITSIYNDGQFSAAESATKILLKKDPDSFIFWYIYSAASKKLGKYDTALKGFKRVVALNPNFADAYNNLGVLAYERGSIREAIDLYDQALERSPDHLNSIINKGKALIKNRKLGEAVVFLRKAHRINSQDSEICFELGKALWETKDLSEAISYFQKSLKLEPENASSECLILHLQRLICDWQSDDTLSSACSRLGVSTQAVPTFPMLSLEDNAERQFLRSQNWASERYTHISPTSLLAQESRPDRIRIGYFSADFRNFPGMILMVEMFSQHDRQKFEIFAFSYGPKVEDEMTLRVSEAVDHFIHIHDFSDFEAAELAREKGIDIAIHRNGYTKHQRTSIFAHRAAPIQINYLGYPGTLGADFIDYIIADEVVIPNNQRKFYTENVIYLPDTYQPNDDTRVIPDLSISHRDVSLPEGAFVFCCFNNSYKISAAEFDIWMRLLRKVDGSVLWLLESNQWMKGNLEEEAEKRGVHKERLVFAPKIIHAQHLARHQFIDIFLDTFNYNAHTTASDALWAGIPVVTKVGEQFSARVSASLLHAVGLKELVTTSNQEYESLVLDLAADRSRLRQIKEKLNRNKKTHPLFDTKRYTRNFEKGLEEAYSIYLNGDDPRDIWVNE